MEVTLGVVVLVLALALVLGVEVELPLEPAVRAPARTAMVVVVGAATFRLGAPCAGDAKTVPRSEITTAEVRTPPTRVTNGERPLMVAARWAGVLQDALPERAEVRVGAPSLHRQGPLRWQRFGVKR